jgi:small multidrug resistance pump
VSVAYAIWSGVGTALIASIGVLWFKEPATAMKLISLGLIIIGVVGLNLSGAH